MFIFHPYHVFMKTEYSSLVYGIWWSMVFAIHVLSELILTNHFLGYRSLMLLVIFMLLMAHEHIMIQHMFYSSTYVKITRQQNKGRITVLDGKISLCS